MRYISILAKTQFSLCKWRPFFFFLFLWSKRKNSAWYTADWDSAGPNCVKTVVYYKLLKMPNKLYFVEKEADYNVSKNT